MGLSELDDSAAGSIALEVDGVRINQIIEVSGLKIDQDVIELKQNTADGKYVVKKLPGRPKAGEVTLTRSRTDDNSFEKWIKDTRFGKQDGRDRVTIIVYDYQGNPIKRYRLTNAWPKSVETLKAGDTSVLTEKLVITHEGLVPE